MLIESKLFPSRAPCPTQSMLHVFERVYPDPILLHGNRKTPTLCLTVQCQIPISREGSTWPLPPQGPVEVVRDCSPETCNLTLSLPGPGAREAHRSPGNVGLRGFGSGALGATVFFAEPSCAPGVLLPRRLAMPKCCVSQGM